MITHDPTKVGEATDDISTKCYICARYYGQTRMVEYEGSYFCRDCFPWRFNHKFEDEAYIVVYDDPVEKI